MNFPELIKAELLKAALAIGAPSGTEPLLERPRDPSMGDWATNMAMVLARPLRKKPVEIAQALKENVNLEAAGLESIEIAGPGFINFRLNKKLVARSVEQIIQAGDTFGKSNSGQNQPVVVEFVSANPTGPLHVGHGRGAALGDSISTLMEWSGWKVTREYYYNDSGVQIENLSKSVQAHLDARTSGTAVVIPEGGYRGEYIGEIAARYDSKSTVQEFAVAALRHEQDLDLKAFGVRFDVYFLESSLYTDGKVEQTVTRLTGNGATYESEGALWLKTTEYGDSKDRVMRKSDGTYTYFVPDVAYHVDKWNRGFQKAINIQGSDHHGTVARVRAGLQALDIGIPEGYPDYVLHQMVTVMKNGEEVKLSKRAGSYVTVRDLIDWVGKDAVRYFFLMRKGDSHLVFDVDLAQKQSDDNPVYYIQMAHARLCGIFRVGEIDMDSFGLDGVQTELLAEPEEQALIKELLEFPSIVAGAAQSLEPHRIANYLLGMAGLAHHWYHKHHVLGEAPEIMSARLTLAKATLAVLRNGLTLLGISAPERM